MKRRYRDVLRVMLLRTASDTNVPLVRRFISVKLAIGQFSISLKTIFKVLTLISRAVHELHPSHAFLNVPDKPSEPPSSSDYLSHIVPEVLEELCSYLSIFVLSSALANNRAALKHLGVKCAQYEYPIMILFSALTFPLIYIAVSLILLVLAFIAQSVILSISVPIVNLPVFQGTSIPLTAGIIHRIY